MGAADSGSADIIELLLAAGADPRVRDANGLTALDIAIEGQWGDHARIRSRLQAAMEGSEKDVR